MTRCPKDDQAWRQTPCLIWQGARDAKGYGRRHYAGKNCRVHRVVWFTAHGAIPTGVHVLHRCDVPACYNLAHLFLGTNAENVADKIAKGRQPTGARHGAARLNDDLVREAMKRFAAGDKAWRIARSLGVHQATIRAILVGRTWRHVTGGGVL